MLITIAAALIFLEFKNLVSPTQASTEWELRLLLLLGLILQFLLLPLGNKRKHKAGPFIGISVWSAYLLSDWLATLALSILLRYQKQKHNDNFNAKKQEIEDDIIVLWTPFLLLQLGGPDTITAYSLQDNNMWLRHMLGLVIQIGTACYVYYLYNSNSPLQFIAILIFVAGIIKFGERIWVLRSASSKEFQNSVFSTSKQRRSSGPESMSSTSNKPEKMEEYLRKKVSYGEAIYLHEAYLSFKFFTPLFSDLTLRIKDKLVDIFISLHHKSMEEAFELVNVELNFLYDVVYTKRTLLHSTRGVTLRFICFFCSVSAAVAFFFVAMTKHLSFPKIDFYMCVLLLLGVIVLDIYSLILHCLSPWMLIFLSKRKGELAKLAYFALDYHLVSSKGKDGLLSVQQFNLIDCSVGMRKSRFLSALKLIDTDNILFKHQYTTLRDLDVDLKKFIYSRLREKHERYEETKYDFKFLEALLAERGGNILLKRNILDDLRWSIDEIEFTQSLLIWHIATDLCYFHDIRKYGDCDLLGLNCQISRTLSDYMMYLLEVRSCMLPKGISDIRIKDTVKETSIFCSERDSEGSKARDGLLSNMRCRMMYQKVSKSVLFDGLKLSGQLQEMVNMQWAHEEKWEMISQVWVEMLTFAASQCPWEEHIHQLRHGKELLTHVSVLMLHLGLSSHVQVVKTQESGYPPWRWDQLSNLASYLA